MHRTDGDGHVANQFVEGDPLIPTPPTAITAPWMNAVQEELAGVIEAAGLTLNKADNTQLRTALDARFGYLAGATRHAICSVLDMGDLGSWTLTNSLTDTGEVFVQSGGSTSIGGRVRLPAGATVTGLALRVGSSGASGLAFNAFVRARTYDTATGALTFTTLSAASAGGAGADFTTGTNPSSAFTWVTIPVSAAAATALVNGMVVFNVRGAAGIRASDFRVVYTVNGLDTPGL